MNHSKRSLNNAADSSFFPAPRWGSKASKFFPPLLRSTLEVYMFNAPLISVLHFTMKPQNYSLKFQNSLAESRIIPGSQHGKEPVSKTPKARNGHRSQRKLTKYQQSLVQKKISKVARPKSLNAQDGRRSPEKQQMSQNYATQRAAEKAQEAKTAEKLTGKIIGRTQISRMHQFY